MVSGKSFVMLIGEDYGWQVIMNPKQSDLKAGGVINGTANGGGLAPGIRGHTGVISTVSNGGTKF